MSQPSPLGERRRHIGERNLRAALIAAAVIGVVVGSLYWQRTREAPPTHTDLPPEWFLRPATQDPSGWRLRGAPALTLNFEQSAARVLVIPENRPDIAAAFENPGDSSAFQVARRGADVAVTGGVKASGCASSAEGLPTIILRTPLSVEIRAEGAVVGAVSGAESLILTQDGCGAWTLTGASQDLWLAQQGPGQIAVAKAGRVRAAVDGSGEITVRHAEGGLDGFIHGEGRIRAGQVDAQLDADVRGRGRIEIESGFVGRARAFVQGRGLIRDRGAIGGLTAHTRHGGTIQATQVRGAVIGRGEVQFGRPKAPLTL